MIRLAVVGCAGAAQQYIDIVSRVQSATFVAAVDADAGLARSTGAALGASVWATSLQELLDQHAAELDAVLVHSENCFHPQHAAQGAQAGKHLLVETPLALSSGAADEMIAARDDGNVCLMLGQADRFQPSLRVVREELAAGHLGQPGLVRVHRWEGRTTGGWQQSQRDVRQNGGTILGRVVRDIDLACWLIGRQPTEVFAVGRNPTQATDAAWDYVQLHLGFAAGAMALIDYCGALPAGDDYFSLSVVGSTGAAYADDHHNMQLLYRDGSPAALKTDQAQHQLLAQLQEFVGAIEAGREPSITATDGRHAVRVAEAANESIATGQTVHLAE